MRSRTCQTILLAVCIIVTTSLFFQVNPVPPPVPSYRKEQMANIFTQSGTNFSLSLNASSIAPKSPGLVIIPSLSKIPLLKEKPTRTATVTASKVNSSTETSINTATPTPTNVPRDLGSGPNQDAIPVVPPLPLDINKNAEFGKISNSSLYLSDAEQYADPDAVITSHNTLEPAKPPVVSLQLQNMGKGEPHDDGSGMSEETIDLYITSILDLSDTRFERMECPGQDSPGKRYHTLVNAGREMDGIKYFFALDLYNSASLLPRLMSTIVQVVKFLGPENCALSVVEGRSDDGTYLILNALRAPLHELGVLYHLKQSDINPTAEGVQRIGALAELRNMAMEPLLSNPEIYSNSTITIFINDIVICPDDILELLWQHGFQEATMTCAMDWIYGGNTFYDAWISRSMSGDTFFEIPQDVSWAFNHNMFWDHPLSKQKYEHLQPFQVYACWGGMATLSSGPFIEGLVKFRNNTEGECYMGEPTLLGKDLWALGLGRIATVPTVNVAYTNSDGGRMKKRRGQVAKHIETDMVEDGGRTERIEWMPAPGQVKCNPSWNNVYWVPPV